MKNKTQQNTSQNTKTFRAVVAVMLVLSILAVVLVGVYTNGFADWSKIKGLNIVNNDALSDDLSFSNSENLGLALVEQTQSAEGYNIYTLTATIKPECAINKNVDWSLSWVNPSSEWATDKIVTDYVTVVPNEDCSNIATVACLAAFGERISVTVTLRSNSNIAASCVVNYGYRYKDNMLLNVYEGADFPFPIMYSSGEISTIKAPWFVDFGFVCHMYLFDLKLKSTFYYEIGTKFSSLETVTYQGKPTIEFYNSLKVQGLAKSKNDWCVLGKTFADWYASISTFVIPNDSEQSDAIKANMDKFLLAIASCVSDYDFEVKVSVTTEYETKEYILMFKFDRSASSFIANESNLNKSEIVF